MRSKSRGGSGSRDRLAARASDPAFFRPARMKASIGVFTHAFPRSVKVGGVTSLRGWNAQCFLSAGLYEPNGATTSSVAKRSDVATKQKTSRFMQ